MKKVVLITDVNFWEKTSGNRRRIEAMVLHISKYVDLTVVNTGPAPADLERILSDHYDVKFIILDYTRILSSREYLRRFRSKLKDQKFDSVIIEYVHNSYFLDLFPPSVQMILDAHDIISERTREFAANNYAGELFEMDELQEVNLFNCYDYVILLSPDDLAKTERMIGNTRTLLCPHPAFGQQQKLRKEVSNIVFIASSYLPNVDGIQFFIDRCWPAIAKKHLVTLNIYGTVNSQINSNGHNLIFLNGFVNDLQRIYEAADIVINPVRFGSGLKIKNVEALSYGIPLVTTSHSALGLGEISTKELMIADTAEEFIESIYLLINNFELRKRIGNGAYEYATKYFSSHCFDSLIDIIN